MNSKIMVTNLESALHFFAGSQNLNNMILKGMQLANLATIYTPSPRQRTKLLKNAPEMFSCSSADFDRLVQAVRP